jgi:hypothetical protein
MPHKMMKKQKEVISDLGRLISIIMNSQIYQEAVQQKAKVTNKIVHHQSNKLNIHQYQYNKRML